MKPHRLYRVKSFYQRASCFEGWRPPSGNPKSGGISKICIDSLIEYSSFFSFEMLSWENIFLFSIINKAKKATLQLCTLSLDNIFTEVFNIFVLIVSRRVIDFITSSEMLAHNKAYVKAWKGYYFEHSWIVYTL